MPRANLPALSPVWPVLKRYDRKHLLRLALPLGGIGTGTVSLGGRGHLRDWEVINRPNKGFMPDRTFFALWTKPVGGEPVTRALEGPVEEEYYEGGSGATARNHGLPRFQEVDAAAAYPLMQVRLADPAVPVAVRIEAFNPLVPGDAESSGLPVAVLRYVLINRTNKPVDAAVCGSIQNVIGTGAEGLEPKDGYNEFHRAGKLAGLFLQSNGVARDAETWGSVALSVLGSGPVTHRTAWEKIGWSCDLLDFWNDFNADGQLEERERAGADQPIGSLAVKFRLAPRAERAVTFLLTWHFPNRQTWTPPKKKEGSCGCASGNCSETRIGNYYTTRWPDAWAAAQAIAPELPRLEQKTVAFVRNFCDSDLPPAIKDAALSNISTLRTQTTFRTPDGRLYGWEGCGDKAGCCHGSCTHVWNYEQATAFLFGDLAWTMRETEFLSCTDHDGLMSFRVNLPLARSREFNKAAADGQMGCVMKLYREWRLSGDEALLKKLWPGARKTLEFCWIPGGWDADQDGVMEGCQHNTMDVEYFGPNPQMTGWYLGALRAGEEMARHLGEEDFARRCHDLFERGSRWMDEHLFNGEYYEHHVVPITDEKKIAPGLMVGMGAKNLADPDFQLGAGCLVDQLVGQFVAHVCGLGYLHAPERVQATLRNIYKYNFKESLAGHFNHLRSFVLNDEPAFLMCSYPKGREPRNPFPYCNEVMTGFEYTAAVGALYEGDAKAGLRGITAVRSRYDGRRRNPFNEAECGHHYARAMASWAAVLAWTGFQYSAVTGELTFADRAGTWFWSTGHAWGTCRIARAGSKRTVELDVLHGELKVNRLTLSGYGDVSLSGSKTIVAGKMLTLKLEGRANRQRP